MNLYNRHSICWFESEAKQLGIDQFVTGDLYNIVASVTDAVAWKWGPQIA